MLAKTSILTLCICIPMLATATTSYPQFKQAILSAHNHYRAKHHAPPLIWDQTLADYALKHANQCRFQHSRGPYGENLATGYRSLKEAQLAWYQEKNLYSYSKPQFSMTTGHFTQVVWSDTKKIGCAYVACNGLHNTPGNFLVCEYFPHGNVTNPGFFARNVKPETKPA